MVYIISLLVLFLDQLSKWLVNSLASDLVVINKGVVFGLGINLPWWFFILLLTIVGIISFSVSRPFSFYLLLVFSAGLSNIIDRFFKGGVADFQIFSFSAFNLADIAIIVAVLLIIKEIFWPSRKYSKD